MSINPDATIMDEPTRAAQVDKPVSSHTAAASLSAAEKSTRLNSPTVIDTNQAPGLKSVMDMAVWRLNFLEWNARAEAFDHPVLATTATNLIQNPSAP